MSVKLKCANKFVIFVHCSYCSDTSEFAVVRNQNENLSVSPISTPLPNSITEVDAINNNRNADSNLPRKLGYTTCQNQHKSDNQLKVISGRRLNNQATTLIPEDGRLSDWLDVNNIDALSKNAILAEQFTYDDFIYGMEKSDLHRIGLK